MNPFLQAILKGIGYDETPAVSRPAPGPEPLAEDNPMANAYRSADSALRPGSLRTDPAQMEQEHLAIQGNAAQLEATGYRPGQRQSTNVEDRRPKNLTDHVNQLEEALASWQGVPGYTPKQQEMMFRHVQNRVHAAWGALAKYGNTPNEQLQAPRAQNR